MDCGKLLSWNKHAKSNQCKHHLLVYVDKLTCTGQVFRYEIFGRKITADTSLVETLQRLLQYD